MNRFLCSTFNEDERWQEMFWMKIALSLSNIWTCQEIWSSYPCQMRYSDLKKKGSRKTFQNRFKIFLSFSWEIIFHFDKQDKIYRFFELMYLHIFIIHFKRNIDLWSIWCVIICENTNGWIEELFWKMRQMFFAILYANGFLSWSPILVTVILNQWWKLIRNSE